MKRLCFVTEYVHPFPGCIFFEDKNMKRYIKTAVGIVILLLAWQLAASSGFWSAYVLPSPAKVGKALMAMAKSGVLWKHIWISGARVLKGFGIAFMLAFICGLIEYGLPHLGEYYGSFLEFMRNVPPISLIALLILWFGILCWPPFFLCI